jgi:two-component system nitrate/nitrite response regulator NarL
VLAVHALDVCGLCGVLSAATPKRSERPQDRQPSDPVPARRGEPGQRLITEQSGDGCGGTTNGAAMNVVLCDQQRLFSDALAAVLMGRGWNVVSVAVDPARAVAAVASEHVDLCLMELSFPEGNSGIEGIAAVHGVSPDTKVVVLTASSDPQLIVLAVEAGADAVLFKDDNIDHIMDVAERTRHAGVTRPTVAPRRVAAPEPASATEARCEVNELSRFLTKREHEVLEHLVLGESGKYLARQMNISYSTARTHIQNVLAKLGVHSRLEAVAFAVEHDLCQGTVPPASAGARDQSIVAA